MQRDGLVRGALLALARGDLGAAEAALDRAQAFAREVRDAGFSAHVRLSEVEVAAYAGKPWPAAEVDADLSDGSRRATRWSSATCRRRGPSAAWSTASMDGCIEDVRRLRPPR